jgi:hypothetical protein
LAAISFLAAACVASSGSTSPGPRPTGRPVAAWTFVASPPAPVLGGVLFGGSGNQYAIDATGFRAGFVVVGEDWQSDSNVTGRIWTTTDGRSWVLAGGSIGTFADSEVDHIATNGRRLVAIGIARHGDPSAGPPSIVWVSDDGVTWHRSEAAAGALAAIRVTGIAGGPQGFVVVGATSSGAPATATSPDGESWSGSDGWASFADARLASATGNERGWFAVGSRQQAGSTIGGPTPPAEAFYSVDGSRWSSASIDGPQLGRVVAGSSGLLATGAGSTCGGCVGPNNVWHSEDGHAWRLVGPDPLTNATYATDGARIVRLGTNGGLVLDWSVDGLTWQPLASGLPGHDAYGALAVGEHGILLLENPPGALGGAADQTDAGVWFLPTR